MSESAAKETSGDGAAKESSASVTDNASPAEGTAANDPPQAANDGSFENLLGDVPLLVTVELGRVRMPLREVGKSLAPGSIIPLSKLTGESLDIRVNDRLVARAEAIAIGERYGVRIVEIISGDSK
ncbi:MAG: flagellar motor switch protein FliN [Nannocystaceae bacterium]|nr:flagellar motor switch protein FliN [Nannocystaceae bacterium]